MCLIIVTDALEEAFRNELFENTSFPSYHSSSTTFSSNFWCHCDQPCIIAKVHKLVGMTLQSTAVNILPLLVYRAGLLAVMSRRLACEFVEHMCLCMCVQ